MQLRLKPRTNRKFNKQKFNNQNYLIFLFFFLGIFLLDKIDFPTPTKLSNKKLVMISLSHLNKLISFLAFLIILTFKHFV